MPGEGAGIEVEGMAFDAVGTGKLIHEAAIDADVAIFGFLAKLCKCYAIQLPTTNGLP